MNRLVKRLVWFLVASVVTVWWAAQPTPVLAQTQLNYVPLILGEQGNLCRFGVNGAIRDYPVRDLRLSWYIDYQATRTPTKPRGIDYFPMIRLTQTGPNSYAYSIFGNYAFTTPAQLRAVIANNRGTYWFIGNEPDRRIYQDDIEPHVYAAAYHDLYHFIKAEDPTAKIAAGSIVQPTPVRFEYLDLIMHSYFEQYGTRMPVDVWAFHNFILNEVDCPSVGNVIEVCWGAEIPPGVNQTEGLRVTIQDGDNLDLFKQKVIAFRQWMARWGYRNTPAFLSEFGILMPEYLYPEFDAARVNAFMGATFDFLLTATDPDIGYPGDNNRLVQRFSWYSVSDDINHNGFLFNPRILPVEASRTPNGDFFAAYTRDLVPTLDFLPLSVGLSGPPPLTSQGATTVTLAALIANQGDHGIAQPAQVSFFNGNPANGGTIIGAPQPITLQGCGEQTEVRLAWPNVAPGEYEIFVRVDGFAGEVNLNNNQASTTFRFSAQQLAIPYLRRPLISE